MQDEYGMVMKQRGGTKQNQKENAERFSIYIFLIRNEANISNLHLQNWEDSANICQMCTIHTVMSTDSTVLLLPTKTKQKSQCNEASGPLKRAQRYLT